MPLRQRFGSQGSGIGDTVKASSPQLQCLGSQRLGFWEKVDARCDDTTHTRAPLLQRSGTQNVCMGSQLPVEGERCVYELIIL